MDMGRVIFSIVNGGSENPFELVDLDEESRKYIHIRANNVKKVYDNGEVTTIEHHYPLQKCDQSLFTTALEKFIYENRELSRQYCN